MNARHQNNDADPVETKEWCDALKSVIKYEGVERAAFLLREIQRKARKLGVQVSAGVTTPYINTISPQDEPTMPSDLDKVIRICDLTRWNALATVLRAGNVDSSLGGHIASYASAALLYEIGFNYFFKGQTKDQLGDLIYIQGHCAPGIYARAFLEGRLTKEQIDHFRREVNGKGISSYPHPWTMPDFWQFPTVSMGLGPLQAIYQARFLKYLSNRGLVEGKDRKVWAFIGDGETDEPETLGVLALAKREQLDNLIFVINCNLQRLDGPVRGNGKVIQELEGVFRGAGWRVIKVIWNKGWDKLLEKDKSGLLIKRMEECPDGEYQNYSAKDGAYMREHFFGKYPELLELIADMSDEDLKKELLPGGHDLGKVYAAYAKAQQSDLPVVILAHTIKGFGMGAAGEGQNITHQQKKMKPEEVATFANRFKIPIKKEEVKKIPLYRPPDNSEEIKFIQQRRQSLGGYIPTRSESDKQLDIPDLDEFSSLLKGTGEREISTTMVYGRILTMLLRHKSLKPYLVPIVADESRTFGMEGLFRQVGIYSPVGQLYEPEDRSQVMYYHEAKDGQLIQDGISEAGAFCSWIAAGTSYSTNQLPMVPFFIYYSMFGFQRIGDFIWAASDMRARGFLIGSLSGRTSLAGEGLQHCDGQSHIYSSVFPTCRSYDPTYAYEMVVIIREGLKRMYRENHQEFYYMTVGNENYTHPEMPKGKDVESGIIKGMYLLKAAKKEQKLQINLLSSGALMIEALKAQERLEKELKVGVNVWSVTSFTELRREALAIERENRLHPDKKPKESYVMQCLKDKKPVVAVTDYVKLYADQIRAFVPQPYYVMGTDGFGRSDTTDNLRYFFEVNAAQIAYTALYALTNDKKMTMAELNKAKKKLGIKEDKADPFTH